MTKIYKNCVTNTWELQHWPSICLGRRHKTLAERSAGLHLKCSINSNFYYFSFFVCPPEHGCEGEDGGHTHANPGEEGRGYIRRTHVKISEWIRINIRLHQHMSNKSGYIRIYELRRTRKIVRNPMKIKDDNTKVVKPCCLLLAW